VALILAIAQAALCLAAIAITGWSKSAVLTASGVAFALGLAVLVILEQPMFTAGIPENHSVGVMPGGDQLTAPADGPTDSWS
jgi:hypothetical protein